MKFSDIKRDQFDDIVDRIIHSFGIDCSNVDCRIDFDTYVRIKCFMKYSTLNLEDVIKIWLSILNPRMFSSLPKSELCDLFERFARGKTQSQKTLVSAHFSEKMITLLEREGCENPDDPR